MSNFRINYRPQLLERINAEHTPTFESYCSLEQGRTLKELGVTTHSGSLYFENIVRVCVRPETVPDDERQYYNSIITDDAYGFAIEMLVEDVKIFISSEVGEWPIHGLSGFVIPFQEDETNVDKTLVYEYNKFPAYSEHELERMYIRMDRASQMPRHNYGAWAVELTPGSDIKRAKLFTVRAEALAQGIIDILTAAPLAPPQLPKLELREKIDFNSPEAQARMANLQKSIDSLNSHKNRTRCLNGCTNCKCNPVYGTSR